MHRRSDVTIRPSSPTDIKNLFTYTLLSAVILGGTGCTGEPDESRPGDAPQIVATVHPFATVLRPIVGQTGTVASLLPPDASPHTYSPRPSDVQRAADSRALVYGHHHFDGWATDITAPAHIELFPLVPDSLQLPFPPGLSARQNRPEGRDPHFWTDPLTVKAIVPPLIDKLCEQLPDHCPAFETNGSAFIDTLETLDRKLGERLKPLQDRSILLATPFLQYFLHRYDLTLAGVIEPVPGTTIAPRTLQYVIQTASKQEIEIILAARQLSTQTARTVSSETGIPLYRMDVIGDHEHAPTYTALIMENARLLLQILG